MADQKMKIDDLKNFATGIGSKRIDFQFQQK